MALAATPSNGLARPASPPMRRHLKSADRVSIRHSDFVIRISAAAAAS
jgi:hypothetical protein